MADPYRSPDAPPCPHCGTPLVPAQPVRICGGCGGVFVSRELTLPRDRAWWERNAPRSCPECGTSMLPRTAGREVFDWCPQGHGVWFDAGELATMFADPLNALDEVLVEVLRRMEKRA